MKTINLNNDTVKQYGEVLQKLVPSCFRAYTLLTPDQRKNIRESTDKLCKVHDQYYLLKETPTLKMVISETYNFIFDKVNGDFKRWGKSFKDDPQMAPFPEILDIEVTTQCCGIPNKDGVKAPCQFCYKSNTPTGVNMTFENFQKVIDSFPFLCQIAIGADSEANSNPDLWKMMEYTRSKGIVPNITVANITDDTADKLAKYCGAVAVSRYPNKDICYNSIEKLTNRGMKQINIHILVSEETYDMCLETLNDAKTDTRLKGLNAIVLLSLKKKGRGKGYHSLSIDKFKALVDYALQNKVNIGFDSCSCHKFLESVKDSPDKARFEMVSESCESSVFSSYCDVNSNYYPCSFCEGEAEWAEGLSIAQSDNFIKDIWFNKKTNEFRKKLFNNNRKCPMFDI